jgi:tRNA (cmo5U34)-methyltransferase
VKKDDTTPYQAVEYDRKVRATIPFYEAIHDETIDLVKTVNPDVAWWLDTGCGTGHLIEMTLDTFPSTRFILADPAETMLCQAKERLAEKGDSRTQFLKPTGSQSLAEQVGDTSIQVITAILCHHYLRPQDRHEAIQTCFDLLDDGGLFVTVEIVAPRTARGIQIGLARWKHCQIWLGRSESEVDSHIERFGTKYFPITADDHVQLMKNAGFQVVEMFWLSQMQAGFYGIK